MNWTREMPSVADLDGQAEEYFWVQGGNFNRPVMVRANAGVTSSLVDGKRAFRAEVNFTVVAENYPEHIWAGDLLRYPGVRNWEWAGPVPRPASTVEREELTRQLAAERERIVALLAGIDQTENESDVGWWETSTGAEFGRLILAKIKRSNVELTGVPPTDATKGE